MIVPLRTKFPHTIPLHDQAAATIHDVSSPIVAPYVLVVSGLLRYIEESKRGV